MSAAPVPPVEIVAAACVVDGAGTLAPVERATAAVQAAGGRLETVTIAPLSDPWDAPPDPARRRFKSGCAPLLALRRARELLSTGEADAVLIQGREPLRTGYSAAERRAHMEIWPGLPVPEAYTTLCEVWMARVGLQAADLRRLADALLDNYARTADARGLDAAYARARQMRATRLFTYADCANPHVDFEGAALLARPTDPVADAAARRVVLQGLALREVPDGPDHVADIARYDHLAEAFRAAAQEAGVADLAARLRDGEALLEAYTCFPPVPLAFLRVAGLAEDPAACEALLARRPVTVTGGMNLARAPWNNPVLHALGVMHQQLRSGPARLGVLHGNGGLGGYQGVAVLGVA